MSSSPTSSPRYVFDFDGTTDSQKIIFRKFRNIFKDADQDAMLENEKTKLKNQSQLYVQLIRKLHNEIAELEKDKFKYAKAAGDANQQYYDSLEQVKVKNTLITKL